MRDVCGDADLTGEAPGLGEPVGVALGLVAGVAEGATVGLATGGFGGSGFGGSQAVNAAMLAAIIVDNINDLLIVFLLSNRNTRTKSRPQHRHPQPD